jgi:site-specific DNA recombinase
MGALIYARQSLGNPTSIADQIEEATADAAEQGYADAYVVKDGTSASRHRKKDRANWPSVLAAVASGAADVVILWETSRGSRDLADWVGFLDLCRKHRVLIRVVSDRTTYDMRKKRDWKTLAEEGISNAYASEETSERVNRAVASAARKGRPPVGPCPYGYERYWDEKTGKLIGQRPHPAHAPIVREIFERVAQAEPIRSVCRDLDTRGIPTPNGAAAWRPYAVRKMCTNPAYVARRRHKGAEEPGNWTALIEEVTYQAARRVLLEPSRIAKHTHPGAQKHLLSYFSTCAKKGCGGQTRALAGWYSCAACQGFKVRESEADDLIRDLVIRRLSSPDIYKRLRKSGEEASGVVRAAESEIAELRGRLDEWRASAAKGKTTPDTMASVEQGIAADIAAAERRRDAAALPAALAGWTGPIEDVTVRWAEATVQARRAVIRALVRVSFVSAGGRKGVPIEDRIRVDWI